MIRRRTDFCSRFLLLLPPRVLAAGFGLLLVAACDAGRGPAETVARVNGAAISHEALAQRLTHAGDGAHDAGEQAALDHLIDRQLLQAEAIRAGIDRDPQVRAWLANARNEILAQAYLQQRALGAWRPRSGEIREYYERHPEHFSKRKQFELDELTLTANEFDAGFKAVVDGAQAVDDVAAWLDGKRVAYVRSRAVRGTDELPPSMAATMREMQPGRVFVVRDGDRTTVMSVESVEDSPLTLEAASARIERLLVEGRLRTIEQSELARLRASADIEYLHRIPTRIAGAAAPNPQTARAAQAPAMHASMADAGRDEGGAGQRPHWK